MKASHSLSKYIQILLTGLCILFVGILWYELSQDYVLTKSEKASQLAMADKGTAITTETTTIVPVTDYEEIIERHLFMDTRRPQIVSNTPATETTQAKTARPTNRRNEEFLLSAVIITDEKRIAIVQASRAQKQEKVVQGEIYNGWVLEQVSPDNVSFKKGNQTKRLELLVKTSPSTPPTRHINRTAKKTPPADTGKTGQATAHTPPEQTGSNLIEEENSDENDDDIY